MSNFDEVSKVARELDEKQYGGKADIAIVKSANGVSLSIKPPQNEKNPMGFKIVQEGDNNE